MLHAGTEPPATQLALLRRWYADQPATPTGWAAALRDPVTAAALHAPQQYIATVLTARPVPAPEPKP